MPRRRTFTEDVREAIRTCGLSQSQLGRETGISQASLSLFLNGRRGLPLHHVDRLAALLGWSLDTGRNSPKPARRKRKAAAKKSAKKRR